MSETQLPEAWEKWLLEKESDESKVSKSGGIFYGEADCRTDILPYIWPGYIGCLEFGGYQGDYLAVYRCGQYWANGFGYGFLVVSYGSCMGCDVIKSMTWKSTPDKIRADLREYLDWAREFTHWFDSREQFIKGVWDYDWEGCATSILNEVEVPECFDDNDKQAKRLVLFGMITALLVAVTGDE